jgi:uncharacterized protein YoxC
MAKSSEQISKYNTSGGKTDANLANDALHLNGIPGEEFATQKYVQDYHNAKEELLKEYIDEQDALKLQQAKSYTDTVVENQDFSAFAKVTDVQALDDKLSNELSAGLNTQKNYTDGKVSALANDVNENFEDVGQSISSLNRTTRELFTSVSNGKSNVAAAITDQGVSTASDASFDTMATNIRKIPTGGGEPDPYYVNTGDATAVADDIMLGKTAYVKGEKIYGNHVDTGIDTSDATATPYDILQGKTAYVNGQKLTGILDLSGEVPTYSSPDGVEKVYGSSNKNYKYTNILNTKFSEQGCGILYNCKTSALEAIVSMVTNQIKFYYVFGDSTVGSTTNDISNIITSIENMLKQYSDYSPSNTNELFNNYIGATDLSIPKPYIALFSTYRVTNSGYTQTFKEGVLTLLPINKVDTLNGNAHVITYELDTQNAVFYALESNSNVKYDSLCSINENGEQILILGAKSSSFVISVNIDTLSITNCIITNDTPGGSWVSTGYNNSMRIIPTTLDRIIAIDNNCHGNEATNQHLILFLFLDSGKTIVNFQTLSLCTVSSDLAYGISADNKIYSLSVNFNDNTISSTPLKSYSISENIYAARFIANNKLLLTNADASASINYIYEFDITKETPFKKVSEETEYLNIGKLLNIEDKVYYSFKATDNPSGVYKSTRILELEKDYSELVALKYNGEYFYRQAGGILTAGQPDVRAGKSFIGWMGYPEVGTMQESEE